MPWTSKLPTASPSTNAPHCQAGCRRPLDPIDDQDGFGEDVGLEELVAEVLVADRDPGVKASQLHGDDSVAVGPVCRVELEDPDTIRVEPSTSSMGPSIRNWT